MRIRMTSSIPGQYDDGRPWPPAGGEIDVAEDHGRDLILGGHAVNAYAPAAVTPPVLPFVSEPSSTAAGPGTAAGPTLETIVRAGTATAPAAATVPEPEAVAKAAAAIPDPEPEPDPASPPSPADPKADWTEYAVSQAKTPAEAETARNMTKADLMSRYGGRL